MPTENVVKLLGKSITLRRLTLRGWANLEGVKKDMDTSITEKNFDKYYQHLIRFIGMTSDTVAKIDWNKVAWYDAISVYSQAVMLNSPTIEFPILTSTKADNKKLPWEYDGRSWFFWLHILSSNYGWKAEYIAELDIDTAIGLYQEILLQEQLEKEWQWGLSEVAYPYSTSTKKQEYKAMERPEWMLPLAPKQLPVIKMRKSMMPVGNIVDLTEKPTKGGMNGI